MQINLLVEGGNMQPGPALSQKLGPAGVNIGQVLQKVNQATQNFKGMKVPIEVDIDLSTKEIHVKVFSPPVGELLKKEFGIEKGSGNQIDNKVANASIEQIISVAKVKMPNLLAKTLKAAVKEVVGSCVSLGILIESKPAKEIMRDIDAGKYDNEIQEESTETSKEKRKELDAYLEKVKEEYQKKLKKAEEEKAAAEAAATATAATTATTATVGEDEKTAEKPAEEKKEAAKKETKKK